MANYYVVQALEPFRIYEGIKEAKRRFLCVQSNIVEKGDQCRKGWRRSRTTTSQKCPSPDNDLKKIALSGNIRVSLKNDSDYKRLIRKLITYTSIARDRRHYLSDLDAFLVGYLPIEKSFVQIFRL